MTIRTHIKNYLNNTSGTFSIVSALTFTAVTMGTAVAIDLSSAQKTRDRLYNIADSAALAGASASERSNAERIKVVEEAIEANSDAKLRAQIKGVPIIQFDDAIGEVTVGFDFAADTLFSKVLNQKKMPIKAQSVATYGQASVNPVSIAFALDVSGSMGWNTTDGQVKINALKQSVTLMFTEIESQIDDPQQLQRTMRTGMSTYNTSLRSRTDMSAGWRDVATATNRLSAGGGTNSTPSLEHAYRQILDDRFYRQTYDPSYNPATLKEFVIFMTDGDNNRPEWDDSSYDVCVQMKNDGIEVFTVAFAAPEKGQALLLDCASRNLDAAPDLTLPNCREDIMASNPAGLPLCKAAMLPHKDDHFFDAADSAAFKDAFREIGKEIVERGVRVKA